MIDCEIAEIQKEDHMEELGVLALQMFFTAMEMAKKTEEEKLAFYYQEKAKFEANKPENLPDV